ncbi:MAG: hypothetical protein FIB07_12445 [Candidatus Methanoperedens sp.]|nr:hypothetical protein [Candidatus Methanoperedens sp.]
MQKCYNVSIIGKVQDVGFRNLIEEVGRLLNLAGYVFNASDGSVRMVCRGESGVITKFFKEIQTFGEQKGAIIDNIQKEEISVNIFLPEKFSKLYTDEIVDLGRKLDIGIDVLRNIKGDTSVLSSFVAEQRVHNQNLEKILDKLADR